MSSRPVFKPHTVVNSASMAANITSEVTIVSMLSKVGYSVTWNGTSPVGMMVVEVSNDFAKDAAGGIANPGTWTALPLSSVPQVSGNSDAGYIEIDSASAYAMRIRYVATSGTGLMSVVIVGKVA